MHHDKIVLFFSSISCFNFETRWPIVKESTEGSHFGYAVDGYQHSDGKQWSIMVGAPTASGEVVIL